MPVEVFFGTDEMPLTRRERLQAKDICHHCPVRFTCLRHSLETREYWGIWGGLDERERRALMREHKTPDAAVAHLRKTTQACS